MENAYEKPLDKSQSLSMEETGENYEKYQLLMYKVNEKKVEKFWAEFEENNFEPILIKGWSAAQYYPKPFQRQVGDIDIAVNPKFYEKAIQFKNKTAAEEIDLHKGLRHLDKLSWDNIFANSQMVKCGSKQIRVLRPEDNLRVLCVHWLTDGGIYKEKLWDIYYLIENRPANFDWNRFLNSVSQRRRKWLITTIGLTSRYLGLNIDTTPIATEAKTLPKWVTETVENEWTSEVKFRYLETSLSSRREFFNQLKKRFPPNAIQSTINMEGDFDSKPRIIYQLPDMILRFFYSIKGFSKRIFKTSL